MNEIGPELIIIDPLLLLLIDLMLKSTSYLKLFVLDRVIPPRYPWLVFGGGGIEVKVYCLFVGVSLLRMSAALVFFMKWSKVVNGFTCDEVPWD